MQIEIVETKHTVQKRKWRIVYVNGSRAVVNAPDYQSALERSAKFSAVKIRDIVLVDA